MNKTDCRSLPMYRIPNYQKRVTGIDNYISIPHARTPSPNRPVLIPRRRHSTPPASARRRLEVKSPPASARRCLEIKPPPASIRRRLEVKSPPANTVIKYYYPNTRPARAIKDQSPISDSVKSPPRPVSLVRQRHQEERAVRTATTPTNVTPTTDVILPIAKKNRSVLVETPSPLVSEIQSINHNALTRIQWKKRAKGNSIDLSSNVFTPDEDYSEASTQDDTDKPKSIKCPCRFSQCNFSQWYYKCPFCCWIICFLLVLALLIGIVISIGYLLEINPSQYSIKIRERNTTMNDCQQNSSCNTITIYNVTNTSIRYVKTIVAVQSYSRGCLMNKLNLKILACIWCLFLVVLRKN